MKSKNIRSKFLGPQTGPSVVKAKWWNRFPKFVWIIIQSSWADLSFKFFKKRFFADQKGFLSPLKKQGYRFFQRAAEKFVPYIFMNAMLINIFNSYIICRTLFMSSVTQDYYQWKSSIFFLSNICGIRKAEISSNNTFLLYSQISF